MAKQKRKISPQTRVKESQSSKKRQRGLKNTSQGGQFLKGRQALHTIFQGAAHPVRYERDANQPQLPGMERYQRPGAAAQPKQEPGKADKRGLPKTPKKERDRQVEAKYKEQQQKGRQPSRPTGSDYKFPKSLRNEGNWDIPAARGDDKEAVRKSTETPETTLKEAYSSELNRVSNNFGVPKSDASVQEEALTNAIKITQIEHGNRFKPTRQYAREVLNYSPSIRNQPRQDIYGKGLQGLSDPSKEGVRNRRTGKIEGQPFEPGEVSTKQLWRDHRGTVPGSKPPPPEQPATWSPDIAKGKTPPMQFIETLPQEEKDWVYQEMQTEGSPFYQAQGNQSPGNYRKLKQWSDMHQHGYGAQESKAYHEQGGGNKRKGTYKRGTSSKMAPGQGGKSMEEVAKGKVEKRVKPKAQSRKGKAQNAPRHQDVGFGIQVPGMDKLENLKKEFPEWSDADILRLQLEQGEAINEYALAQNQRWAHEQRAALLKEHQTNDMEKGDRVVVFTTNLGAPAVSVPSNSLVGQYVIKKRKKMLVDNGYRRWQVKGEFPRAVRDMHVMELSTGFSAGLQGRYGVFHNTGWRKGAKTSKGFGAQVPVGTQVLRDSSGDPVYDKQGNIRYTEGYTREISGATKDVGMRIFIG